jgi:hypothetical protein
MLTKPVALFCAGGLWAWTHCVRHQLQVRKGFFFWSHTVWTTSTASPQMFHYIHVNVCTYVFILPCVWGISCKSANVSLSLSLSCSRSLSLYLSTYVCIYMNAHTYTFTHTHTHCIYTHTYMFVCVCVCVCVYVCVFILLYLCMYSYYYIRHKVQVRKVITIFLYICTHTSAHTAHVCQERGASARTKPYTIN